MVRSWGVRILRVNTDNLRLTLHLMDLTLWSFHPWISEGVSSLAEFEHNSYCKQARYEPSHLDLHCLQMYLYWSSAMKVLKHQIKSNILPFIKLTFIKYITLSESVWNQNTTRAIIWLVRILNIKRNSFFTGEGEWIHLNHFADQL